MSKMADHSAQNRKRKLLCYSEREQFVPIQDRRWKPNGFLSSENIVLVYFLIELQLNVIIKVCIKMKPNCTLR